MSQSKLLSDRIIAEIEAGYRPLGARLPSSRDLAKELNLSRDVVVRCYEHLHYLGYIETKKPHGTFVSMRALNRAEQAIASGDMVALLSEAGKPFAASARTHPTCANFPELNFGAAPAESLPRTRWRELLLKFSQVHEHRLAVDTTEIPLSLQLLDSVALYLKNRGLMCTSDQIFVSNNSGGAVENICRLLLNPGEDIACEDPGFGGIKNIAQDLRLNVIPIAVDEDGLVVEQLERLNPAPRLLYVTASSHDPTGVPLSLARKHRLISWANRNNVWIIDDDFDGFFTHGKSTLPLLWSMDTQERVIYISTLWQILYPLTTASVCVVPHRLSQIYARSAAHRHGVIETTVQTVLATMMSDGYLLRHTKKWQRIFARRLHALVYELKSTFKDKVWISKHSAGLNCFVRFSDQNRLLIAEAAIKADLPMVAIGDYYMDRKEMNEFIVHFGSKSEEQLRDSVQRFANYVRDAS